MFKALDLCPKTNSPLQHYTVFSVCHPFLPLINSFRDNFSRHPPNKPSKQSVKHGATNNVKNQTKSPEYMQNVIRYLEKRIFEEIDRLGGNATLKSTLELLHVDSPEAPDADGDEGESSTKVSSTFSRTKHYLSHCLSVAPPIRHWRSS